MSEVARQKPRRATRGSRTGWAWLNVKIPWQIKQKLAAAAATAGGSITTEVAALGEFFYAEPYHQQYLAKNPNGYCGIGGTGVSCPVGLAS